MKISTSSSKTIKSPIQDIWAKHDISTEADFQNDLSFKERNMQRLRLMIEEEMAIYQAFHMIDAVYDAVKYNALVEELKQNLENLEKDMNVKRIVFIPVIKGEVQKPLFFDDMVYFKEYLARNGMTLEQFDNKLLMPTDLVGSKYFEYDYKNPMEVFGIAKSLGN